MTRKIKYRAVRNATYDPAEARRAREWSVETIESYYGIKVPKSLPKLRKLPAEDQRRRRLERAAQLRLEKYHFMVAQGIPRGVAMNYRNASWVVIYDLVDSYYEEDDAPDKEWDIPDIPEKKARENWNKWSAAASKGKDEFPEWVKTIAGDINENEGLDRNARYGYACVWTAYVLGIDIQVAIDTLGPDDYAGNFYEGLEKLL